MKSFFPTLPEYSFSWRSLQLEPIPMSGERITLGVIVKGDDRALLPAKLITSAKLRKMYGNTAGKRIADGLSICMDYAANHYEKNPLSNEWSPPLEGFYLGQLRSSLAEDIENALSQSARSSSSLSMFMDNANTTKRNINELSAPEDWRRRIFNAVMDHRSDFENYFERGVTISGFGMPLKFSFLSEQYAAQFDAVIDSKNMQHGLIRAQSKLWQLDRLRDENSLFPPDICELILKTPSLASSPSNALVDFVEELKYEASKRDIGVYSTDSAIEAAQHVIARAA